MNTLARLPEKSPTCNADSRPIKGMFSVLSLSRLFSDYYPRMSGPLKVTITIIIKYDSNSDFYYCANYNSYHLLSTYYIPSTLYLLSHLILKSSWWSRHYYRLHLIDFAVQEKREWVSQGKWWHQGSNGICESSRVFALKPHQVQNLLSKGGKQ